MSTLIELRAKRDIWLKAREAIATRGISYSVGDRAYTSADLMAIDHQITRLTRQIIEAQARAGGAKSPMFSVGTYS